MRLSLDVCCSFVCDVDYFENSPTFHSTPDPHSKQKKERKKEKGTKSHILAENATHYSLLQKCQLDHFSIYESK